MSLQKDVRKQILDTFARDGGIHRYAKAHLGTLYKELIFYWEDLVGMTGGKAFHKVTIYLNI